MAPTRNGHRFWGGFDPATEQIRLYQGWDTTTAFEELLHWEDMPRLRNYFLSAGWDQARWDAAITSKSGMDWNNVYAIGETRVRARMIQNGFTPVGP